MKKRGTRLLALVLSGIMSLGVIGNANLGVKSVEAAGEIAINKTNFEDDNFRQVVLDAFDLDGNKSLSASEINKVDELQFYYGGEGIKSLKGIEHFTALKRLQVRSEDIKSIDISKNTLLEEVELINCGLTRLDLSKNVKLKELNVRDNSLNSLDIRNNVALTHLYCQNNKMTSLTLGNNSELRYVDCSANALTALDFSSVEHLYSLKCQDNPLKSLWFGENYTLSSLDCSNGQLTSLDVSRHTALRYINCTQNNLSKLNLCPSLVLFEGSTYSRPDLKVGNQRNNRWITVLVKDAKKSNAKAVLEENSDYNNRVSVEGIMMSLPVNLSSDPYVGYGQTITFEVLGSGEEITYQWYWRKSRNDEWQKYGTAGPDKNTLSIVAIPERNGFGYYCLATDKYGNTIRSTEAQLHVISPYITESPADVWMKEGSGNATFSIEAVGPGTLTYQWYWRRNSNSEWAEYGTAGTTKKSISVGAIKARDGFQYRCIVTDGKGGVRTSRYATLTVSDAITITRQPQSVTVLEGTKQTFSVGAYGEGLTYQWYWRKNASSEWGVCGFTGAKTASMTVEAIAARNGYRYRCEIKDKNGNKRTSNEAVLSLAKPIVITSQPKNIVAKGGEASFTVGATGEGLTYQWQWRKNASSAWGISDFKGCKTSTLYVEAISARNGFQYRCMIKDSFGRVVYSNPATLTYGETVKITKQPFNVACTEGVKVTFSVQASGDGLTYLWYWRKNETSDWGVCGFTGAQSSSMVVEAIAARNGYQYRCRIKDKYGNVVYTEVARLGITSKPIKITTQPVSKSAANGSGSVKFSIAATGENLTYQWYIGLPNSDLWFEYGNEGTTNTSISVDATNENNGYQYRCRVRDGHGNTLYSNIATLTVTK